MKLITLLLAALSLSSAHAVLKLPVSKPAAGRKPLNIRSISETLTNKGFFYSANVTIGTPPQHITLDIDTGSSDIWVYQPDTNRCQVLPCVTPFNSANSSTFKVIKPDLFATTYGDSSAARGDLVQDFFTIGGASLKNQTLGVAKNSTVGETAVMGIGYAALEASEIHRKDKFTFPSLLDNMVDQGVINHKAYSLYLDDLDDNTGTIIFGGLDSDKYIGDLVELPVNPVTMTNGTKIFGFLDVTLNSIGLGGDKMGPIPLTPPTEVGSTAGLLDSGSTMIGLPPDVMRKLALKLNATPINGTYWIDCDVGPSLTVDFNFGNNSTGEVTIKAPISEMMLTTTKGFPTPIENGCLLGIQNTPEGLGTILGDTFLRSAYVVYDLQNNVIALAQTKFNSTTSNIVEFPKNMTSIPGARNARYGSLISVSSSLHSLSTSTATSKASTGTPAVHGSPAGLASFSAAASNTPKVRTRTSTSDKSTGSSIFTTTRTASFSYVPAQETVTVTASAPLVIVDKTVTVTAHKATDAIVEKRQLVWTA